MLSVPFVGWMRAHVLEENGYDIDKIKRSSPEELENLDGFSRNIAERIIKYARMVDRNYYVPEELVFQEFRCPKCNAIVSEVEPVCHSCGHKFREHPENYEALMDELAEVIVRLYEDPNNPDLWRKGERILSDLEVEEKAADFKFKASALELEMMETEESHVEDTVDMKTTITSAAAVNKKEGRINGLVNGSGVPVKTVGERRNPLNVLLIAAIILVPIILAGVLVVGSGPAISIDGNFSDWNSKPSYGLLPSFFHDFKMVNYDGNTFIYIRCGELFSNDSMQQLAVLVDDDSNRDTGYPVNMLGVDRIIEIYGTAGNLSARVIKYEDSWTQVGRVDYAYKGGMIEMKAFRIGDNASILLYYYDGRDHYSSVITSKPHLWAMLEGGTLLTEDEEIARVILWNSGTGAISLKSMDLWNMGNTSVSVRVIAGDMDMPLHLSRERTTVDFSRDIKISNPYTIRILYSGGGKIFGTVKPMVAFPVEYSVIDKENGSYVEKIPRGKSVDGVFLDWKDAYLDCRSGLPDNIDVERYGTYEGSKIFVYLSVYGMLFGTGVPLVEISGGNGTGGNETQNATLPEDTIEIYVDSDNNTSTGYHIGGMGADYLVRISGNLGEFREEKTYKWEGKWVLHNISLLKAKNYNSAEIGIPLRGKVYFRLVNFEGLWDRIHPYTAVLLDAKMGKSDKVGNSTMNASAGSKTSSKKFTPKFVGEYNVTELKALFGTDVQVTTSTYDESKPTITRTSDGTLWAAFTSSDSNLYFANSTDGGATWIVYTLDKKSYNLKNPFIISDSSDNVYIFFDNHTTGANFSYWEHPFNAGATWYLNFIKDWNWWDKVYNLSAATYTVGSNTYIYVVFEYAYSSTDFDVGYVKWDGSGYWYEYHDYSSSIAFTSAWEGHPSVTISTGTNPKVFVAYDYYNSGDSIFEVMIKNNTDINGTKWGGNVNVAFSGYHDVTFPCTYGTGDVVYVVGEALYNTGDHDIWVLNTTNNGNSWSKYAYFVANTNDDERYPWVVANGGDVHVFFLNITSGYILERESADYGVNWGNVIKVSDQGSGVAVYGTVSSYYYNGNLYVVWTDNRNGNDDIYFDKVPEFNGTIILFIVAMLSAVALMRKKFN